MATFEHIIDVITKSGYKLSQFCVLAMMVLLVINIILRKAWHPITGSSDFVGFIAAILASVSVGYVAVVKGHVAVDLIMNRLPERGQLIVEIIAGILSFGIFSLVSWQSAIYARATWVSGEFSMSAYAPFYPFLYVVAFGIAVLCLVILSDTIKAFRKAVKR
jgi:TRAP-type C4-dicarboxylate transport system permease small subunit